MGPDGVQGPVNKRGLIHEHPIVEHGGVYRWEELREPGAGVDTVSTSCTLSGHDLLGSFGRVRLFRAIADG